MSATLLTRHRSKSSRSHASTTSETNLPRSSLRANAVYARARALKPCAATASYFLYAHSNIILSLHHDSLDVERRFEAHQLDVLLIAVDNFSERGAGRLAFSVDVGDSAIVWDLLTATELARFTAYHFVRVATWMRNGSVAFGDSKGDVVLFEPSTSEHVTVPTLVNPITALAPAADSRTFAIGYENGSIVIVNIQPFAFLHTLRTSRPPSPVTGLAWHGSSSKQKSDMLATQTTDDLRVWSITKPPHADPPRAIRILGCNEPNGNRDSWFAWSKNGRIVQHCAGETRVWDVRTKRVTHERVPTVDDVAAITSYGPTATLFTLGRNHTVQQYDLNPQGLPLMVAERQHVPPSPPPHSAEGDFRTNISNSKVTGEAPTSTELDNESTEEERLALSPLQKITREMDHLEDERRDRVAPLSPVSSRASLTSSNSSYADRRSTSRMRDPIPSPAVSFRTTSDITTFSSASSMRSTPERGSMRSSSSVTSSRRPSSSLRHEMPRYPGEIKQMKGMDLFPSTKARLSEVRFRTPRYGQPSLTADVLRCEMLSVVFGWDHDIESLIRNEQSHHVPGSASGVLLSKWLGDLGADSLAQMVGSNSMTSSDWMLLALSCSMGQGSQKQVGEAFVKRLLETDETHPAVAILLGLGQHNEAIEVYVSRKFFLEAVLLTCLLFPHDWQRQSYLVRKWGEAAVSEGKPELAVRCFSCTTIEPSEHWTSPRAQDAVYAAQQQMLGSDVASSPITPPSTDSAMSNRMTAKTAALRLITDFGTTQPAKTIKTSEGITPIADSALTGGVEMTWIQQTARQSSSARTATPGAYRRKRMPSESATPREAEEVTPLAAPHTYLRRRTPQVDHAQESAGSGERQSSLGGLPAPAPGAFGDRREASRTRGASRERNHHRLQLRQVDSVEVDMAKSPSAVTPSSKEHRRLPSSSTREQVPEGMSPLLSDGSMKSYKGRSIDKYINSLEEASYQHQQQRTASRTRGMSRDGRSGNKARQREASETRDSGQVPRIRPGRRSPSSPVPMTLEDVSRFAKPRDPIGAEQCQTLQSPINSSTTTGRAGSRRTAPGAEVEVATVRRGAGSPDVQLIVGSASKTSSRAGRAASRQRSMEVVPDRRGRSEQRWLGPIARSPSPRFGRDKESRRSQDSDEMLKASAYDRLPSMTRQRSTSRCPADSGLAIGQVLASRDAPSTSRRPLRDQYLDDGQQRSPEAILHDLPHGTIEARSPRPMSRKELAAKELEERRLSLARRPSVPIIPYPGETKRTRLSPRSVTDIGVSPPLKLSYTPYWADLEQQRSQTVDPDIMARYNSQHGGTSTASVPIGLPATPRAMRHPRYMSSDPDERDSIPAVPALPENFGALVAVGHQHEQETDGLGPLLPSSVYGQKGPTRSASAPPDHFASSTASARQHIQREPFVRGHVRKQSDPELIQERLEAHGDEAAMDDQIIVVEESEMNQDPPLLAELQHLAGPPPPPPPPSMYESAHSPSTSLSAQSIGIINIAMAGNHSPATTPINATNVSRTTTPAPEPPFHVTPSSSPNLQRRGRISSGEALSSKWRNVTDRMRSNSKSRTKSPPMPTETFAAAPYETFLPPIPFTRSDSAFSRTKSPQAETAMAPFDNSIPPPPPPPPLQAPPVADVAEVPSHGFSTVNGGYRNPKEIRANMPPDQLQAGVCQVPVEGGMI